MATAEGPPAAGDSGRAYCLRCGREVALRSLDELDGLIRPTAGEQHVLILPTGEAGLCRPGEDALARGRIQDGRERVERA